MCRPVLHRLRRSSPFPRAPVMRHVEKATTALSLERHGHSRGKGHKINIDELVLPFNNIDEAPTPTM
jgi:hypothetical protein